MKRHILIRCLLGVLGVHFGVCGAGFTTNAGEVEQSMTLEVQDFNHILQIIIEDELVLVEKNDTGIYLLLKNAKTGILEKKISLTNSGLRYLEEDGKLYPVDLWPAPPPNFTKVLSKSLLLLGANMFPSEISGTFSSVKNPIYVGVFDLGSKTFQVFLKGHYLAISNVISNPIIVMVESYMGREPRPSGYFSSDPIIFAWKFGQNTPSDISTFSPWLTSPKIVFPERATPAQVTVIGGHRLLGPPVWSDTQNLLAGISYEIKTRSPSVFVLDFRSESESEFGKQYRYELIPVLKRAAQKLIDTDTVGFLHDDPTKLPVRVQWETGILKIRTDNGVIQELDTTNIR